MKQLTSTLMEMLKQSLSQLRDFDSILAALKLFSTDFQTISKIDRRIFQLTDSLTKSNQIDLLNTKSITRQRNSKIIESCIYNLSKNENLELTMVDIQKCLLSCGILNVHDETFYKFLITKLKDNLKNIKTKTDFDSNETELNSIITSIGMSLLLEQDLINLIAHTLIKFNASPKLLINLVISCAFVNFAPKNLSEILAQIKPNDFKMADKRDNIIFLNYVWSRCVLDVPDNDLIAKILDEKFSSNLVAGK